MACNTNTSTAEDDASEVFTVENKEEEEMHLKRCSDGVKRVSLCVISRTESCAPCICVCE